MEYLLAAAKNAGLLTPDADTGHIRKAVEVFQSNLRAFRSYRAGRYEGKVLLFRATGAEAQAASDGVAAWNRVVEAGVEVHWVPSASHFSIMQDPHIMSVVRQIGLSIDETLQRLTEGVAG
jgi:thioesterase domain-containing protein